MVSSTTKRPRRTGPPRTPPNHKLVTVDALAPVPRVTTASRRKVVGVDCVERFILSSGSPVLKDAS